MAPMRLGDGTSLRAKGYSQVRKGDGTELWNAIPDSALLQIDATQDSASDGSSISTLTDFSGENNNLTGGSATYQTGVRNGNPVYDFDGVDDEYTLSSPTTAQPYTLAYVVSFSDNGEKITPFSTFDDGGSRATIDHNFTSEDGDGDTVQGFAGNLVSQGTPVGGWQLITAVFDGANSVIWRDGAKVVEGDLGTHDWSGFRIGNHYSSSRYLNGPLGELLFYDADLRDTGELSTEEQRLADKWGITI